MGIKAKILLPTIGITLIVALAILISNIVLFSGFIDNSTLSIVNSASKVAVNTLDFLKAQATSASLGMAENQAVIHTITRHDRDALLAHALQMQEKTGVEFCTVTDPQGTVLVRTHAPESYGDSVASQRNIQSAMAGKSLTLVEQGRVVRLSVRSGAPVFDGQGALVGVVSVGYRLDAERFVDLLQDMLACEVTVFLGDERIATTLRQEDGRRALGTKADARISGMVLAGESYAGRVDILGRAALARYTPLANPDGQALGMLLVGQYADAAAPTMRSFVQNGLTITALMLAVAVALILVIAGRLVTPIHAMASAASALASGDLDIDIRVHTQDEIRTLADALGRMIENTRQQAYAVERIANGDLTVSLEARSEKDVMNRALAKLSETLRAHAAASREEHTRIKLMLDATPLACWLWDEDFRMVECNEAAVWLFELRDKQEYIARYFDLSPEYQPDGQKTRDIIRSLIAGVFEKGACAYEWSYRLLDGTPLPAENTLVRVPYGDGYAVAAYSRDLRQQKKMMAEIEHRDHLLDTGHRVSFILFDAAEDKDIELVLAESMALLGQCVSADQVYITQNEIVDGVPYFTCKCAWVGDPDNVKSAIAPGMSFPWGLDLDWDRRFRQGECLNGPVKTMPPAIQEFFAPFETRSALVIPVFVQGKFWGLVGFSDCKRERFFGEDEVSILRSTSLIMAAAVNRNEQANKIRDTSARLEAALTDAKEANNAKSRFLAHMSHEIRTPLNAVIGLSELALGEGNLDRETTANLEKICAAGSTILSIVNNILDISKIESGKFELNPVHYDTPSLINDTVTLNMVRIQEKPITFALHVDENLPGKLYGDDLRVKQIFNNLLSNAIKYTQSGTVEWQVSFERDGKDVWLVSSVRDTGIGIRPEDTHKLFLDYNQVDMRTNRSVGGSGLGLAIAKLLVEMMDGSITVESEYGKGSTFRVRLRQALVSPMPIGKKVAENLMGLYYTLSKRAQNSKLTRINMSYAHVLVVDDIPTNLDVVRGMMKPYGLKVDCATSGGQAVQMIRSENPRYSAVFMDHMMPGMDGIEATTIIRKEIGSDYARDIPIIALTANAIVGNEELFLRNGFQAFISKPIDMLKLDAVLRRWVRNRNLEREFSAAGENSCPPGGEKHDGGNGNSLADGMTVDGMDARAALELFGGNEETFLNILRSYVVNTRPLLRSLREYLAAENFVDYGITIHGIKGASYGIAAQRVGKEAERLEHAAKEGNLEAVQAGHPAFDALAEALIAGIGAALGKIEAGTRKPGAAEPAPELLQELREACAAFDMDSVDKAMEQLESFRYERGGEIVAWLREQVTTMNFEKVSSGEWPSE